MSSPVGMPAPATSGALVGWSVPPRPRWSAPVCRQGPRRGRDGPRGAAEHGSETVWRRRGPTAGGLAVTGVRLPPSRYPVPSWVITAGTHELAVPGGEPHQKSVGVGRRRRGTAPSSPWPRAGRRGRPPAPWSWIVPRPPRRRPAPPRRQPPRPPGAPRAAVAAAAATIRDDVTVAPARRAPRWWAARPPAPISDSAPVPWGTSSSASSWSPSSSSEPAMRSQARRARGRRCWPAGRRPTGARPARPGTGGTRRCSLELGGLVGVDGVGGVGAEQVLEVSVVPGHVGAPSSSSARRRRGPPGCGSSPCPRAPQGWPRPPCRCSRRSRQSTMASAGPGQLTRRAAHLVRTRGPRPRARGRSRPGRCARRRAPGGAGGLLRADQVDRPTVRLGQQERTQRAPVGVRSGRLAPQPQEHLLHDLLGGGVVAEEAPGETVDAPPWRRNTSARRPARSGRRRTPGRIAHVGQVAWCHRALFEPPARRMAPSRHFSSRQPCSEYPPGRRTTAPPHQPVRTTLGAGLVAGPPHGPGELGVGHRAGRRASTSRPGPDGRSPRTATAGPLTPASPSPGQAQGARPPPRCAVGHRAALATWGPRRADRRRRGRAGPGSRPTPTRPEPPVRCP